jgi:hypothetical protein
VRRCVKLASTTLQIGTAAIGISAAKTEPPLSEQEENKHEPTTIRRRPWGED